MKKLVMFLFYFLAMGCLGIYAQSLGQDDQTRDAESDAATSGEKPPSLRVVPFQWIDLVDTTKGAKVFSPEASLISVAGPTDEAIDNVNMEMSMKYFGESYSSMTIVTNGFVALGQQNAKDLLGSNSYSPSGIPSPRPPNNIVAPMWIDITFENSKGYIYYRTFKPDKQVKEYDHMVVQWEDARIFNDFTYDNSRVTLTFQLILFTNGGIMFQYKGISAEALRRALEEDQRYGYNTDIDLASTNDFDLIRKFSSSVSIGYENKDGIKGVAWDATVYSGMSLSNELTPDWAVGANGDSFLNILDGRDRRNNAPTSSGGCFIAKKKVNSDR